MLESGAKKFPHFVLISGSALSILSVFLMTGCRRPQGKLPNILIILCTTWAMKMWELLHSGVLDSHTEPESVRGIGVRLRGAYCPARQTLWSDELSKVNAPVRGPIKTHQIYRAWCSPC